MSNSVETYELAFGKEALETAIEITNRQMKNKYNLLAEKDRTLLDIVTLLIVTNMHLHNDICTIQKDLNKCKQKLGIK